ncbi:MAG TPA: class I SAM-dependent methyltransferase [Thermoleophilaceae bacterium]
MNEAVAWHDVECSAYSVDLPLWRELADDRGGPVLDIGCGTGRVTLDLAGRGHELTGLDSEAELVEELSRRAQERGLPVDAVVADARSFVLPARFPLVIAPQQVVQLFGGSAGRTAFLRSAREALAPGGVLAVALSDPAEAVPEEEVLPPLPDVLERDGWVLSSRPLAMRPDPGGVVVERLRQAVSPSGELSEELSSLRLDELTPELLEQEAVETGLLPAGRRRVPETRDFLGSTVVLLS